MTQWLKVQTYAEIAAADEEEVLMATLSRRQVLNAGGAVVGAAALGVSLAASTEAVHPSKRRH